MTPPKFLVETNDGCLHGYWDPVILRIDLAQNPKREAVSIYALDESGMKTRYRPMTLASFLKRAS